MRKLLTAFAFAAGLSLAGRDRLDRRRSGPPRRRRRSGPGSWSAGSTSRSRPSRLANGLRVVVHEDRKAPIVAVSVWYNVGSKDEPAGRTGFAHLFEHLMFNGSENAPGDYFAPLREIGATDFNGTTWFDRTNYFQTVPRNALERALYLESDRMGHLLGAITQENLTNQIGVVQNEKRQGDNEPYGMVEYAQLEGLFPAGHPYHHSTIGSMADLSAASLDTVRDWFRSKYGPNNAVLVLAGDINAAEARPLVERYFGDIARGPVNTPAAAPIPTLPARVDRQMHDRVANTRLYRMWTVPGLTTPDQVPLQVGAAILGGLASSRLDNAFVRGDQSAVRVSTFVQPFQRVSLFEIQVDVKPGQDADAVSRRLDALIADFVRTGPTADEVRRAVMRALSGRVQGLEQVGGFGGKAVALAEGMLYADDPAFYRTRLRQLAATTPAQVRATMQRWLNRPVLAIRVDPGEREAYEEAPGVSGNRAGGSPRRRPRASGRVITRRRSRATSRSRPRRRRASRAIRCRGVQPATDSGARFPAHRARPPVERHPDHLRPPHRGSGHPRHRRVQRRHRRRSGRPARHPGDDAEHARGRHDQPQFGAARRGAGADRRHDRHRREPRPDDGLADRDDAGSWRFARPARRRRPQPRLRPRRGRAHPPAAARRNRQRDDAARRHGLPRAAGAALRAEPSLWEAVQRHGRPRGRPFADPRRAGPLPPELDPPRQCDHLRRQRPAARRS